MRIEGLDTLTIIRHGECDRENLNDIGRHQIALKVKAMKIYCPDTEFCIMTSSAERAVESAQILADGLGIKIHHQSEKFWIDHSHFPEVDDFISEVSINKGENKNIIVLTHLIFVKHLPPIFTGDFPKVAVKEERRYGGGIIIDFASKKWQEI